MRLTSVNFEFLEGDGEALRRLAALGEAYFQTDPNASLVKVRQFAELLAQEVAARLGVLADPGSNFSDVLGYLGRSGRLPRETLDLFHIVRRNGNEAVHNNLDDHGVALTSLKVARQLAVWYARAFDHKRNFNPGPFVPPPSPADPTVELRGELQRLRDHADQHREAAGVAEARAARFEHEAVGAAQRLRREAEDRKTWQALAEEAEGKVAEVRAELARLQVAAQSAPAEIERLGRAAQVAADLINLDEAETRALIDQQLRDAGWQADTVNLRHAKGSRPARSLDQAIAEWPTASGPADYALFRGLKLVGVVEAKRRNANVMEVLPQAERYARDIDLPPDHLPEGAPWGEFKAPFAFSTNGRPYLKQIETLTGIWRRDLRRATNPSGPLAGWPTPAGLEERLKVDREAAEADLERQGFDFGFPLRDYQKRAVEAVEAALAADRTGMLLAMATGAGKTKLAIAMLYRLLASGRFRRVCFVVDRSALGDQVAGEFKITQVVSGKGFADIFGLKGLGHAVPDDDTRVHICTIQGLVKRVLYADSPTDAPAVDQYDLMVVDECHRGYLLDREMSDAELSFRDQADYVSKYRRVLDYFDAVKIGLTATPALHTVDIFGEPIFRYSYREAVIDGWLADQEPPVRITTALSRAGIHFDRDEQVDFVHPPTGQLQLFKLPDDLDFDVDAFNRQVVTEAFNRAVAGELVQHIDFFAPGKTLVFAASDAHADIVVKALRDAFRETYGEIEDAAIRKITGKVDKVRQLILAYRNDALPKIAVTVDLLSTGIDVPSICNLVFLRRVNSRILYEQMIGRATRLCPEIGKTTFRVFDAVDLYSRIGSLTEMRPVAADPKISLDQLFRELAEVSDAAHRAEVRDQIIVKLVRRLGRMSPEARAKTELAAGEPPEAILARFRRDSPEEAAAWAKGRPGVGPALDWQSEGATPPLVPISQHPDSVVDVSHGYGEGRKPEDYLDAFSRYVRENANKVAALQTVIQRPRDLTRADLRELRLQLDAQGFTDAAVRRAWHDAKNEDIAASILGFVRQAALGDPLTPYEERVRRAVEAVIQGGQWTETQKNWLRRIGKRAEKELVADPTSLDEEPFRGEGGFRQYDKRFGGRLAAILGDINEAIWRKAN